ncbi:MAG: YfcE family phosphodiesterase [Candidatus Paceibacterota bacterium]
MKIAILSDSHDSWEDLSAAVAAASDESCEVLFFAGDLVRPAGVETLAEFFGPVHIIIGNNEFEVDEIHAAAAASDNVIYHGEVCDIQRKGIRIFMHHYPQEATAKAQSGIYHLCIHGHTHRFTDRRVKGARVLNPGAISYRGSAPSWGIFDTEDGSFTQQSI